MDHPVAAALWHQFGAAIEMLENAVRACPDALWDRPGQEPAFWHLAFHTLFFLDYYLAESPAGFEPPPPFGLTELDPAGAMPERAWTRAELLDYVDDARGRVRALLVRWNDELAAVPRRFPAIASPLLEVMIYNLRHVQHHSAQLNLLLRQAGATVPGWVARAAR